MTETTGRTIAASESKRCTVPLGGYNHTFSQVIPPLAAVDTPGRRIDIRNIQPTDPLVVQLVEAAGLRDACDLDLLLFFSRHPRVVLSSEQLAAYVGYDLVEVARALDLLLGAGLLKRTLNHGTPGRMYVLEVDHAEEWLEPLRGVCATPEGRNALKALLRERRAQAGIPIGDPSHRRVSGARPS
jgi:hypothetical protein